jgi:hypothetical protein
MITNACQFDISRATDAATLPRFRRDILADETLDQTERDELCAALDRRFAFLNLNRQQFKPRWP